MFLLSSNRNDIVQRRFPETHSPAISCKFNFLLREFIPINTVILSYIKKNFLTLPFTERWLNKFASSSSYKSAFSELLSSKAVIGYPVFVEASRKPVAQAEYTVLIEKDGCVVLT